MKKLLFLLFFVSGCATINLPSLSDSQLSQLYYQKQSELAQCQVVTSPPTYEVNYRNGYGTVRQQPNPQRDFMEGYMQQTAMDLQSQLSQIRGEMYRRGMKQPY